MNQSFFTQHLNLVVVAAILGLCGSVGALVHVQRKKFMKGLKERLPNKTKTPEKTLKTKTNEAKSNEAKKSVAPPSVPPKEAPSEASEQATVITTVFDTKLSASPEKGPLWNVHNGTRVLGPMSAQEIARALYTQELDFDCECWKDGTDKRTAIGVAGIFDSPSPQGRFWVFDGETLHGPLSEDLLVSKSFSADAWACESSTVQGWKSLTEIRASLAASSLPSNVIPMTSFEIEPGPPPMSFGRGPSNEVKPVTEEPVAKAPAAKAPEAKEKEAQPEPEFTLNIVLEEKSA